MKWSRVNEITEEGVYLMICEGDLIGNGFLTLITKHPDTGKLYYNSWYNKFDTLLHCKRNAFSLFFGPIPLPGDKIYGETVEAMKKIHGNSFTFPMLNELVRK